MGDAGSPADAASDASLCLQSAGDIVAKLRCLPGVTIVQDVGVADSGTNAGFRRIDLEIDQLANHDDSASAHFSQQLTLWHRDEAAPIVLTSSGYSISRSRNELSRTFGYNVLQVEHRYFAPSIPNPADWKYLNIKQSAGDYHVITQAFKAIYKGKWVNSGASKGGMTSVYHRRFFPNDLDATVAYVAPNMLGLEDARFPAFIDQNGGDMYTDCRANLKELQKAVLMRRDEVATAMTGTYNSIGSKDVAIEHAVLEMPFTFWQYQAPTSTTTGCSAIPKSDAPLTTFYNFFSTVAYLSNWSDTGFAGYAPYYYQAANQLGAPAVADAHLAGLLKHRDTYRASYYIPANVEPPAWDAEAMVDVQNWVKAEGKTIMFIYGELDPWSAGKFEIGATGDNHVYFAPGSNHSANIAKLNATDRAEALSILERWLGVAPSATYDGPMSAEEENFRPRL